MRGHFNYEKSVRYDYDRAKSARGKSLRKAHAYTPAPEAAPTTCCWCEKPPMYRDYDIIAKRVVLACKAHKHLLKPASFARAARAEANMRSRDEHRHKFFKGRR